MKVFKQLVIALNMYVSLGLIGAVVGSIVAYLALGSLYIALYPGPVTNGHECARGMFAGFSALLAGAISGGSIGAYFASKRLFLQSPLPQLNSGLDFSLNKIEWDTLRGRQFRAACHYSCAGSAVIGLSWLADSSAVLTILTLGFLGVIIGTVAFVKAFVVSLRSRDEPS